jgi:small subunit ribosomal protein S4
MTRIVKSKLKAMRRWDHQIWDNLEYSERKYPPGQHGKNGYRFATSYCASLRVKQVFKKAFLISESKLKTLCRNIKKNKKLNFDNSLTASLELMAMKVFYNCGFCTSIFIARQIVSHGHLLLNGKKLTLARLKLKVGDVLSVREKSKNHADIIANIAKKNHDNFPSYLEVDKERMTIKILREPTADEIILGFKPDFTVLASFY